MQWAMKNGLIRRFATRMGSLALSALQMTVTVESGLTDVICHRYVCVFLHIGI
jgi:hypothetical protein